MPNADELTAQSNLAPLEQLGQDKSQNSAKFNDLVQTNIKQ